MPITIMGFTASSNVQKALWACAELGLDHEWKELGGSAGGWDSPANVALNPNRRVPILIEDGFVAWESASIVRYLACVYGEGSLWPTDAKARARADRWMDWQLGTLGPLMRPVYNGLIRTEEAKRDRAAIAKGFAGLAEAFAVLDRYLAETAFVAGPDFTMGDIPVGISTWRWFNMPLDRPDLPNLARWYAALKTRPGYREHVMKPLA
jgi:glutathione S-transferase